MKSKILLLLLILTFITCKNKPSDNIIDEKFCDEQLEIIIDKSRITIDNESNMQFTNLSIRLINLLGMGNKQYSAIFLV